MDTFRDNFTSRNIISVTDIANELLHTFQTAKSRWVNNANAPAFVIAGFDMVGSKNENLLMNLYYLTRQRGEWELIATEHYANHGSTHKSSYNFLKKEFPKTVSDLASVTKLGLTAIMKPEKRSKYVGGQTTVWHLTPSGIMKLKYNYINALRSKIQI